MLKYVQKETKGNSEHRRWWTERTGTSLVLYCAEVLMVSQYNKWMFGSLISKHQESLKLLSGGVSGPIRHGFYSFQISLHPETRSQGKIL